MREDNNKSQKTMPIQLQEDDLIFKPNLGLGCVLFSMSENQFLTLFDKNSFRKEEQDNGETIHYHLNDNCISIDFVFHYDNWKFEYMSIHTDKLYINNEEISTMSVNDLIFCVKKFHKKFNLDYKVEFEDNDLDISYSFDNIGLTVWYEDNLMSDICINPVFNNDY